MFFKFNLLVCISEIFDKGNQLLLFAENKLFGAGATLFEARVASNTSGGKIELHIDNQNGTIIGTCTVEGSGGVQKWVTKSCTVNLTTGRHDLFLKFTDGSGSLFNFNWWKFQTATGTGAGSLSVQQKSNKLDVLSKDAHAVRFAYNVPDDYSARNLKYHSLI